MILNGAFLISTENDASSRAMVAAAAPHVAGEELDVLIGGLGLGYALDEALTWARVAHVTVAEYEPTVVRWFREYGGERAERAAAAERAGRAAIELADVADVLRARRRAFDLVSLDTDNGPEWLVREENAGLYSSAGAELVRDALQTRRRRPCSGRPTGIRRSRPSCAPSSRESLSRAPRMSWTAGATSTPCTSAAWTPRLPG